MRVNVLYNIPTKYLVFFLGIVSFFWTYMIINITKSERLTSEQLKVCFTLYEYKCLCSCMCLYREMQFVLININICINLYE